MSRRYCQEVSRLCPVEATTYGYAPNLGANAFLCALFAACALFHIGFGTYQRSWSFMVALAGGAIMEAVGYGGRIMMHANVWDQEAFKIQICCLVLAPSFIAACIYLSLKHIILYVGPESSRLKPRLYTWIFIGCDVFSIVVQAGGGGIAAAAGREDRKLLNTGNNLIITGIAIQVVTMGVCGLLALDYMLRHKKAKKNGLAARKSEEGYRAGPAINYQKFLVFVGVEIFAYVVVLIRCIYRLPEMAGGWGNPLMRNEKEFLVLDGMMIALAVLAFSVFHPGWWFPPMTGKWQNQRKAMQGSDSPLSEDEVKA
ncbi:RTA1-like protein 14 [Elsinoe fawcettii]|nr:RTA1-like protein 14 [Elsinoe fawcettii]